MKWLKIILIKILTAADVAILYEWPAWLKNAMHYVVIGMALVGSTYFLLGNVYKQGVKAERLIWQAKESAALLDYSRQMLALSEQYRQLEVKRVADLNKLTQTYELKLKVNKDEKNAVLRDVKSGARKLYVTATNNLPTSGNTATTISAFATQPASYQAQLSETDAQFFINFASECDAAAEQANYTLSIAQQDRAINNITTQP